MAVVDETTQTSIILALISLIGTMVSAYFAAMGAKHSKQANDAVNHRHKDQPRLFDMTAEMYEWKGTLTTRVEAIDERLDDVIESHKESKSHFEKQIGTLRKHISDLHEGTKSPATKTANSGRKRATA